MLPRFLAECRGRYNLRSPNFSIEQILAWADAWHAERGEWPTELSGRIPGGGGVSWHGLNVALKSGRGGFPVARRSRGYSATSAASFITRPCAKSRFWPGPIPIANATGAGPTATRHDP